jgi:hypothetical protein
MAHVGTTTNLKQPAATGSGQRTGVWMVAFAAVVIAAIALAFVMTQLVGTKATNSAPAGALGGDLNYAQIQALRGAAVPLAGDRSYDQIEAQRGAGTYLAPNLLDRGADRGTYLAPSVLDRGADRGGSTQPVPGSLQLKHGFNRDLQP